jgi:hypothetical protein
MRIATSALVALLACGCATEKIYSSNQSLLATAVSDVESGNLVRADASMKKLLMDTGEVADDYAVQRFFAEYLLARVHMAASFGNAFLTEAKPDSAASLGGGPSRKPSPVGHLVATSYHSSYGLQWYQKANGKPTTVDKKALLPPELEELGTYGAGQHLQLCLLTVYSELQFQAQSNEILEAIGATDLESLDKLVADAQATPEMEPWIYRAMWARLEKNDPREAFKFAIRTLETAEELDASAAEEHLPVIDRWLTGSEDFMFICPNCDKEIRANSPVCKSCRGPERMDFVYVQRTAEPRSRGADEDL